MNMKRCYDSIKQQKHIDGWIWMDEVFCGEGLCVALTLHNGRPTSKPFLQKFK